MTMNICMNDITLSSKDDTASTRCLGRQERFRSPMPLFKSLQLLTDTAEKGPVVSPASLMEPLASLQQSPMLLFRYRLMLQQRKVDPGVLPKYVDQARIHTGSLLPLVDSLNISSPDPYR